MLAAVTGLANGWFGGEARVVHAIGSEASGHLTSLLRWPDGSSALLSVGPSAGHPRIDLVLLGSRGALYYRTGEGLGALSA
jgi:hypothetical protein